MNWLKRLWQHAEFAEGAGIARRYFVVNGFDGALSMLGIITGFYLGGSTDYDVVLGACMGGAVALFMSGISSAYISESAERQRDLAEIEQAMARDLSDTAHGRAARWTPWVIGLVNGLSPLSIALLILLPIFLHLGGMVLPWSPLLTSMTTGIVLMFLLGVFLGRIGGSHWLLSGTKALLVGLVTLGVIWLVE